VTIQVLNVVAMQIKLLSLGEVTSCSLVVDCVLNVMAHAQKPDFASRRNGESI
jgi:hypothetical protein